MKILFVVIVCTFIITGNAYESTSMSFKGKTPEDGSFHAKLKSAVDHTCLILIDNTYRGLGIFMSPIYVLTAASLFFSYDSTTFLRNQKKVVVNRVTLGLASLADKDMKFFDVEDIYTYNDYKLGKYIKDIAILRIKEDLTYKVKEPFPELPRSGKLPNVIHVMSHYSGVFLYNSSYKSSHERLPNKLTVGIIDYELCSKKFKNLIRVEEEYHICGSTVEKLTDMDTIGSPLLAGNVLVGIHTYGTYLTTHLFTNVYKERKFIENSTNGVLRVCEAS